MEKSLKAKILSLSKEEMKSTMGGTAKTVTLATVVVIGKGKGKGRIDFAIN